MCGIAGFSGSFEAQLLARMGDCLAHRGPDDEGQWFQGNGVGGAVGLAHRRLAILDLSEAGHQPMHDAAGHAAMVYNGEIYNYRELRAELEAAGVRFRGHSDTEVILELWLREGDAMLARLRGDFALALWDAREQELLLARDPLGVKPLYYAEAPEGLLFASELKALLQHRELDRSLDPVAVQSYLTLLWSPGERTVLRAVRKLEPGGAMRVAAGRVTRQWRHYELPVRRASDLDGNLDEATAVRRTRERVAAAVERQMVSDVPVGAFLSGGLDSSSVVAFARRHLDGRRLQCFTIGFEGDALEREGVVQDLPYAQRVAEHLGVDLHTVTVGPEMTGELESMIYHLDEPQADPAPLNAYFIARLARERGIKVLLSGAGGDDIFTGYRRHYALLQERRWAWLPAPLRAGVAALARRLPVRHPVLRRMVKVLQYAERSGDARLVSYFLWLHPHWSQRVLSADVRAQLGAGDGVGAPLMATLSGLEDDVHALDRMLTLECKHFLPDHNLAYTDKMAMAHGVEVRVPLLDTELVEHAFGLPVDMRQRGREGKWIFKRAMESELPRDVIYRSKSGFGVPLRRWLQHELAPLVEDVLGERSLRERGVFDPVGVRALVEADRAGRVDAAYPIFALVALEMWCRRFVDGG